MKHITNTVKALLPVFLFPLQEILILELLYAIPMYILVFLLSTVCVYWQRGLVRCRHGHTYLGLYYYFLFTF